MTWLPSHTELRDHPKMLKAARALGISRAQMIGHLHLLWGWAMHYAPDGDLTRFDPDDLAAAADWPDDPGVFVDALIGGRSGGDPSGIGGDSPGMIGDGWGGFLDVVMHTDDTRYPQDGEWLSLRLHDWDEYGGKYDQARSAREATRGNHVRWHANRGKTVPSCEYCQAPPDGSADTRSSPGNRGAIPEGSLRDRGAIGGDDRGSALARAPARSEEVDLDLGQGQDQGLDPPFMPPPTPAALAPFELALATTPPDPLAGFAAFWETYPRRGGKRLYRGKAEEQWRKLTATERAEALVGARHYARSGQIPQDAFRWLRDRAFTDWQTPATPDPARNGSAPSKPYSHTRLDELLTAAQPPPAQPQIGPGA